MNMLLMHGNFIQQGILNALEQFYENLQGFVSFCLFSWLGFFYVVSCFVLIESGF